MRDQLHFVAREGVTVSHPSQWLRFVSREGVSVSHPSQWLHVLAQILAVFVCLFLFFIWNDFKTLCDV